MENWNPRIKNSRDRFIGAFVTQEVADGIRRRATEEGKSVSLLVYESLLETLRETGMEGVKP